MKKDFQLEFLNYFFFFLKSSRPEVSLRKVALKICNKFTGENEHTGKKRVVKECICGELWYFNKPTLKSLKSNTVLISSDKLPNKLRR